MKKVRFFPKTTVHWLRISKEEHESRQGLWMQMARDRQRFRRRIRSSKKSNLHYTRRITPKRATSGGAHLRGLAPGQHSSEEASQRWRVVGDTVSI